MDRWVWVCFMPSDFVFVFPYALSKLRMESGYARWEKKPQHHSRISFINLFPRKGAASQSAENKHTHTQKQQQNQQDPIHIRGICNDAYTTFV